MRLSFTRPRDIAIAVAAGGLLALGSTRSMAAPEAFSIEPEDATKALLEFARQSQVQIIFESDNVKGVITNALRGQYEPIEALRLLLQGTSLVISEKRPGVLVVQSQAKARSTSSMVPIPGNTRESEALEQAPPAGAPNPPDLDARQDRRTAGSSDLGEIIVTAQKSSERLQDVPMNVTALSGDLLERVGAVTIGDIGRQVPGLSVVSVGPGQNELILRGLSSGAGAPMVGYYIDDTPVSGSSNVYETSAPEVALFDLDRVEVLRGPQGTLYGASSMGGTVRYITHQPDLDKTEASVKAALSFTKSGGINEEFDTLGNLPIIPAVAAVRAAAFFRDNDGYIDRYPTAPDSIVAALPGPVERNVNTEKTYGARIALEIEPVDALTITPAVYFQRMDLGAPFTFDAPPGSFRDPIQSRLVPEPFSDKDTVYSLTANGDAGPMKITSSTSYLERSTTLVEDDSKDDFYFFSPAPQTYVYPDGFYNRFTNYNLTEELRATADVGSWHVLLGLFYTHVRGITYSDLPITPGYNAAFGTPFTPPFTTIFASNTWNVDQEKAIFGEVKYDITSQLQLTVGARAFRQNDEQNIFYQGVLNGGNSFGAGTSSSSGTTPKYDLSYHFTPDLLVYATASKGFREGGPVEPLPSICDGDLANLGFKGSPTSYSPDSLWNFELGGKTAWLDRSLIVNGAVYYIEWENAQQLVALPTCGFTLTGNFGRAASKGAELEIQYLPMHELELDLSGAFNQAQLTEAGPGSQGTPGQELENAPRWSGAASAEYRRELGAGLKGFARLDINTTSYSYNNFDTTSIYRRLPGYSLANLRFGADMSHWRSTLFVTNLFNKAAETALPLAYAVDLPTTRRVSLNRPRTIGVDFRYDF